mmetsp:Transcript_13723/g.18202  ORF Transcript_13723/g.18202 Transcript_13723/m.18202 type:complete len:281 (-) Transcript_13723:550-1392(-)
MAIIVFTTAVNNATLTLVPDPASKGRPTSIGTIARSWKSNMPNAARPWRVPRSSLSRRSCRTKAEDESAKPPPTTRAVADETPGRTSLAKLVKTTDDMTICNKPRPNTSFFIALRRSRLSSSPISKRKKTIPSSASISMLCISWITSNALGPSKHPVIMKPMIGLKSKAFMTGAVSAAAKRSTSTSRFPPEMCEISSVKPSWQICSVWHIVCHTFPNAFVPSTDLVASTIAKGVCLAILVGIPPTRFATRSVAAKSLPSSAFGPSMFLKMRLLVCFNSVI